MVARSPENLEWLRRIHLFHDLPEEVLAGFLQSMESRSFTAGEVLTRPQTDCEGLCFVRKGKVELFIEPRPVEDPQRWQFVRERVRRVGVLGERDYYSEECALSEEYPLHDYIARAVSDGVLYCWPLEAVYAAMRAHPAIAEALAMVRASRRRIHRRRPKWLPSDEMVYLWIGRPVVVLLARTWAQMVLTVVAMLMLLWGGWANVALWSVIGGGLGLVVGAWWLWEFIDWRNDYCIVTNQRVTWVEKVLFLYESRNETHLRAVLSVGVNTDWLGRMLGYGDVVVRTYGGRILINQVGSPQVIATIIEEHWHRARSSAGQQSWEEARNALRRELGLRVREPAAAASGEGEGGVVRRTTTRGPLWRLGRKIRNFFATRVEENGVITYRKHWFMFVRHSFDAVLALMMWGVGTALLLWRVPALRAWPEISVFVVLGVAVLAWLVYDVVDWHNDIYQITPAHILDIYKKPLGTEEKRSAPLESIENMNYDREGFFGWLFNFGTVQIHVGTTTMTFQGVARPDVVQQEIFRWMDVRRQQVEAEQAARARRDVLQWLKAYHEVVAEEVEGEEDEV